MVWPRRFFCRRHKEQILTWNSSAPTALEILPLNSTGDPEPCYLSESHAPARTLLPVRVPCSCQNTATCPSPATCPGPATCAGPATSPSPATCPGPATCAGPATCLAKLSQMTYNQTDNRSHEHRQNLDLG
uniref:Uncharacterized protein n=1 Tax=Arion vulgaris TaxID=1028688 RepID=A0A0B7BI23_9EUPU